MVSLIAANRSRRKRPKNATKPSVPPAVHRTRQAASGEDGFATAEAVVEPETNLARCVQGKMPNWRTAAPPETVSWVKVHVNLKSK